MESKIRVLFVCIHNSARSQMAEAFLKLIGGDSFEVMSAGLELGKLNPLAVETMREVGVDISTNRVKSAFELYKYGFLFDYVITVCDGANAEKCPTFPGITQRIQWSFEDPSALNGTNAENMVAISRIRDEIKDYVKIFVEHTQFPT